MNTVLKWDLQQRKKFILWWAFGVFLFVLLTLAFYPAIKHQANQLDQSFQNLSQTTKQLFTDTNDIFSPVGYLSSQIYYLLLPLLLGILAILLGSSLVNREEKEGTIELLLSRPVARGKLIGAKAAAMAVIILLVGIVATVSVMVLCKLVGLNENLEYIFEAGFVVMLLALSFGAIAFMVTTLGRRARSAGVATVVVVALGGYIIASLAGTIRWLRAPAKIFPFYYYHAADLLTGKYNWWNITYFLGLITACILVAWAAFKRRDINVG